MKNGNAPAIASSAAIVISERLSHFKFSFQVRVGDGEMLDAWFETLSTLANIAIDLNQATGRILAYRQP